MAINTSVTEMVSRRGGVSVRGDFNYTLEKCKKCNELCKSRKQVVFRKNIGEFSIMVVGEAPGKTEDEKGLPFVGRSGKLASIWFEDIGLSFSNDVYVTNTIKCRPPDNRVPTKKEIENCLPFFQKELNIVKPTHIVALGKTAVSYLLSLFFPDRHKKYSLLPMTKLTQSVFIDNVYFSRPLYIHPVYHPAYILRNLHFNELAKSQVCNFFEFKRRVLVRTDVSDVIKASFDYSVYQTVYTN